MENINKAVNEHGEEVGENLPMDERGLLVEKLETLHMDSLKAETPEERAEIAVKMEEISKKLEEMGEAMAA
ncbi:MAG TPA: hypothetical protein PK886_00995 [Candidatus Paceibacterota bacterium]|nr:hypothetical protein [Candidatus Paceibacterota bacterium]